MADKTQVITDCEPMLRTLIDMKDIDAEIERLIGECDIITELVKAAVKENSSAAQSPEEYLKSTVA